MLPAVSASGNAAINMCANVLVKTKNWTIRSRMRPWRPDGGMPSLV